VSLEEAIRAVLASSLQAVAGGDQHLQ
jgi:hypothetical protein